MMIRWTTVALVFAVVATAPCAAMPLDSAADSSGGDATPPTDPAAAQRFDKSNNYYNSAVWRQANISDFNLARLAYRPVGE